MRVLAFDPGPHTGLALIDTEQTTMYLLAEPDQMRAIARIEQEADLGLHAMIGEKFTISSGTAKKTRAGSNAAIEIIGAARYIAARRNIPFELQTPGDAMGFMTNDKLKALGWYQTGPLADHSRDAARHLGLYMSRNGMIDLSRLMA